MAHGLQDAVHGSHVEDQTQLSDTHCNQAEQEQGAEDALHERLSCNQKQQHILDTITYSISVFYSIFPYSRQFCVFTIYFFYLD